MNHNVIHPNHYNQSGRRECWDEMIDTFGAGATAIFDCLNAYKYIYRAGNKEGNSKEQDMAKADNYINHAKSLIESGYANSAHSHTVFKIISDTGAKSESKNNSNIKKVTSDDFDSAVEHMIDEILDLDADTITMLNAISISAILKSFLFE